MENEHFSKEESLKLIAKMINRAKNENHDKGEGWLLWGWLLFIASISSAVLKFIDQSKFIPWIWNGLSITVFLYFIYKLIRGKKPGKVKTYVEEMLGRFGTGFFLSLFVIIIATSIRGDGFVFGYLFILYAFWMYIYGSAIQFKPLIFGAFVNWAAAIFIFIVKDFKYVMIISAVSVAIGYLVPAYMLRSQYKKSHNS